MNHSSVHEHHTCGSHCSSWTCTFVVPLFRLEAPRLPGSTGAKYLRLGLTDQASITRGKDSNTITTLTEESQQHVSANGIKRSDDQRRTDGNGSEAERLAKGRGGYY